MTEEEVINYLKNDGRVNFSKGTHGYSASIGDFTFILSRNERKCGYRFFYEDPISELSHDTEWRTLQFEKLTVKKLKRLIDNVDFYVY